MPVSEGRADDVAYVSDVITNSGSIACIDRTRVYSTGFSGGARMTSLLGCHLNDQIAAIAPVAGLRWPTPCEGRPVPVLTFHGLADPQNTYDGHAEGRGPEWLESVPEALAGWADHNGGDSDVIFEDASGRLSTMRYEGCEVDAEVRLIRIDEGGHGTEGRGDRGPEQRPTIIGRAGSEQGGDTLEIVIGPVGVGGRRCRSRFAREFCLISFAIYITV